jgi:hypothetical protein
MLGYQGAHRQPQGEQEKIVGIAGHEGRAPVEEGQEEGGGEAHQGADRRGHGDPLQDADEEDRLFDDALFHGGSAQGYCPPCTR